MSSPIYLDYAAATPLDKDVATAMQPYFSDIFYNPSALYTGAREAKAELEHARARVAQIVGCRPSEIVFTSGGTESTNLALRGVAERYPGGEVRISAIEHEAVRAPSHLYKAQEIQVDAKGRIQLDQLKKSLNDQTVLVSVMYANNEVGTVQPIKDIVEIVQVVRSERLQKGIEVPIYVHTDACQAPAYLDINVARLGVDLMTLNGGKIHGPKQSGILYIRAGVELQPQILGGGQEFGIRSGTEHLANAVGFSIALEKSHKSHKEQSKKARELTDYFAKRLIDEFGAIVNGHNKQKLPNNTHVTFPGCDNERVLFSLDEQGVWAASGSACSASSDEVSHVLTAMGISEQDARSSIRFTIGHSTTKDELDHTITCIARALQA